MCRASSYKVNGSKDIAKGCDGQSNEVMRSMIYTKKKWRCKLKRGGEKWSIIIPWVCYVTTTSSTTLVLATTLGKVCKVDYVSDADESGKASVAPHNPSISDFRLS